MFPLSVPGQESENDEGGEHEFETVGRSASRARAMRRLRQIHRAI